MNKIKSFCEFCVNIRKYIISTDIDGVRYSHLRVAPSGYINIYSLISEFNKTNNDDIILKKIFECTSDILLKWNSFIKLPIADGCISYNINRNNTGSIKIINLKKEIWDGSENVEIFAWDNFAHLINEANGYIKAKCKFKSIEDLTNPK